MAKQSVFDNTFTTPFYFIDENGDNCIAVSAIEYSQKEASEIIYDEIDGDWNNEELESSSDVEVRLEREWVKYGFYTDAEYDTYNCWNFGNYTKFSKGAKPVWMLTH